METNKVKLSVPCNKEETLPETFIYQTPYSTEKLELVVDYVMIPDFMGVEKRVVYLAAKDAETGESYAVFSKYFGEFIGQICTTYIDTNNLPEAEKFLVENHIGFKTPFTKTSGYCEYPLFVINPKLLAQTSEWENYLEDFVFFEGQEKMSTDTLVDMFYEMLNKTYVE